MLLQMSVFKVAQTHIAAFLILTDLTDGGDGRVAAFSPRAAVTVWRLAFVQNQTVHLEITLK